MDTFMQNAANTPGGIGDNRYVKTSQYQAVKAIRGIFKLLGIAFAGIVQLIIDVLKGIAGKN